MAAPPPHQTLVQPGDVVDGYKVGRLFAKEGGMGLLYLVEDPSLPRLPLVMKVLPADSPADMVARMEREAHALSLLSSARHVVRIHKTGKCPDGSPYIVMEKLVGEDLQKRLKREGKLEVKRAVEIAVQASMGLHACHIERVLHRDIKPGNLYLHHEAELGEVVKIIDFGISHLGMGPAITALNATSGTRRYMAPEQARGQDDERADQFSLAAVLFEMLTGELPWPRPRANDGGEHERQIAAGKYRRLREVLPDAPEGLEAALVRALTPDPDQRFASVYEFGKELLPFATPEAQVMFRKYGENAGRVRASAVALPVSQQVTVRRSYSDPLLSAGPAEPKPVGQAGKPGDSEYATVASGARPVRRGGSRRYALGLVTVGALGAVGIAVLSRGGERPDGEGHKASTATPPGPSIEQKTEPLPTQAEPAATASADSDARRAEPAAGSPTDQASTTELESAPVKAETPRKKSVGNRPALRRKDGVLRTPQGTAIPE